MSASAPPIEYEVKPKFGLYITILFDFTTFLINSNSNKSINSITILGCLFLKLSILFMR